MSQYPCDLRGAEECDRDHVVHLLRQLGRDLADALDLAPVCSTSHMLEVVKSLARRDALARKNESDLARTVKQHQHDALIDSKSGPNSLRDEAIACATSFPAECQWCNRTICYRCGENVRACEIKTIGGATCSGCREVMWPNGRKP